MFLFNEFQYLKGLVSSRHYQKDLLDVRRIVDRAFELKRITEGEARELFKDINKRLDVAPRWREWREVLEFC